MGYQTNFEGEFQVIPPLKTEHREYLVAFSCTRRMKRDVNRAQQLPDPLRLAVGLPLGFEAAYFVGGTGVFGQNIDCSVINYNQPPDGQPSLWCDWIPSEDGQIITFDQTREKFYHYIEWIEYLIKHFLSAWGYTLNGKVLWWGEKNRDAGKIEIVANQIKVTKIALE